MKKKRKIFIIIIACIILIMYMIGMSIFHIRFIQYMNPDPITYVSREWNINLPKPNKIEIIYSREFPEGEDLEIWHYQEESIREIINNSSFKEIDEENKEFVRQKIDSYYSPLDDDDERLFDEYINVESLVRKENYFAFNTDKDGGASYILLILDCKTGKLYYFIDTY